MTPRRSGRGAAVPTEVDRAPVLMAQGEAYGALDLGTNSCRMLIARAEGNQVKVIDSFSKAVQLGAGQRRLRRVERVAHPGKPGGGGGEIQPVAEQVGQVLAQRAGPPADQRQCIGGREGAGDQW